MNKKRYRSYQYDENQSDIIKYIGLSTAIVGAGIDTVLVGLGGLGIYFIGQCMKAACRKKRENMIINELEKKLNADIQCKNCRYKNKL